ncbi:putative secreted RxLR effector protein [Phytophthora cinnamomi]|uniref:putative secreted RxLR effector protein n=1 Tax=Phytophthora cinnamomi TaxID=4785 RepID=UPI002B2FDCC9|nr:putative secreted RxLR effector protein [Phytophthora cinnamomi]QVE55554.1 RxLR effector protein 50 [Phytophthora cinnamomi]
MRLYCGVLVAATILALGNAVSEVENTETKTTEFSTTVLNDERFLRVGAEVNEDDEERGISLNSIPGIKKITSIVDEQKASIWLRKGKVADDVFTKMKLNKVSGEQLFENKKFLAWAKYVGDYNRKNPDKVTSMIPTLTKNFGDDVVAKMLESATKVASTKRLATSLQTQQLDYWKELQMSADDVFRALRLNGKVDNVLTDPNLLVLNKYLVDFNTRNPKQSTTMVEILTRGYGDVAVMKMLETARKVENTKGIAARLQAQQFDVWRQMGLDSDDVFKLMNLDDGVDKIFANPVFSVWMRYLGDFNAKNPAKKTTVLNTLRSHFSDNTLSQLLIAAQKVPSTEKFAARLQSQQIKIWLDKKELPDNVFKLLQLDKGLDNLLTNPMLSIWVKYATNYKLENPFTTQATMIGTFSTHYGDKALTKMLQEAKKVPKTKKLATDLEADLIKKWRLTRANNVRST